MWGHLARRILAWSWPPWYCLCVCVSVCPVHRKWPRRCYIGVTVVTRLHFTLFASVAGCKVHGWWTLDDDMTNPTMQNIRERDWGRRFGADSQSRISVLSGYWLLWPLINRSSFVVEQCWFWRQISLKTHKPFSGECYRNTEGSFTKPARPHHCC